MRDAHFEPIRGHRAEQLWEAVAQRTVLVRPTLLETHRESFIDQSIADSALAELGRALAGVLERQPDVCFISTEQLATVFDDPRNVLRLRSLAARSAAFLRRVRAEATLSRPLKLCGLYFLLPVAARLAEAVTPSASLQPARVLASPERLWKTLMQKRYLVLTELFLPTKGGTAVWFDEVLARGTAAR